MRRRFYYSRSNRAPSNSRSTRRALVQARIYSAERNFAIVADLRAAKGKRLEAARTFLDEVADWWELRAAFRRALETSASTR